MLKSVSLKWIKNWNITLFSPPSKRLEESRVVLGYVHTVPDSETERFRKCTG